MSLERKLGGVKKLGILFGIVIAVMLISATFTYLNQAGLRENGLETTATITTISHSSAGTVIRVQYTISGVTYENRLMVFRSGAYIGEKVPIYYNVNNHNQITSVDRTRATDTFGHLFRFPIIMFAIGLFIIPSMFFYYRRKLRQTETNAKNGKSHPGKRSGNKANNSIGAVKSILIPFSIGKYEGQHALFYKAPRGKRSIFKSVGFDGTALDWDSLVISYLNSKAPKLRKKIKNDCNMKLFWVYGDDLVLLEEFAKGFQAMCDNGDEMRYLLSRSEEFEDD